MDQQDNQLNIQLSEEVAEGTYSNLAFENSDVCILMIDATRGLESQDLNIFSLIQKNRKGLVVCVNKWDLVENKQTNDVKNIEKSIRERLAPFVDYPSP